jgi:hypothetical protein
MMELCLQVRAQSITHICSHARHSPPAFLATRHDTNGHTAAPHAAHNHPPTPTSNSNLQLLPPTPTSHYLRAHLPLLAHTFLRHLQSHDRLLLIALISC